MSMLCTLLPNFKTLRPHGSSSWLSLSSVKVRVGTVYSCVSPDNLPSFRSSLVTVRTMFTLHLLTSPAQVSLGKTFHLLFGATAINIAQPEKPPTRGVLADVEFSSRQHPPTRAHTHTNSFAKSIAINIFSMINFETSHEGRKARKKCSSLLHYRLTSVFT